MDETLHPAVGARAGENERRIELTYRGLLLGALITLVFTAANVYLGLKVGLTFASSIPAAVISMAVLRAVRNATIWENNIVQTVASAAGTLSSVIFVLPGLVMVGWWTGFPFWESFGICVVGGILGVMYSVPLRRAMVTGSDLPYPEGVAAAEVLRVGAGAVAGDDPAAAAENKAGLVTVVWGSIVSAGFAAVVATNVFIGEIARYFRAGAASVTGFDIGLSMALVGVGHLVGLTVGIAMLGGIVLAWGVLVPIWSAMHAANPDVAALAGDVFRHQVRFLGAGAIGVAAIWSLGRLAGPVVSGVLSSLASTRARRGGQGATLDITERDIPFNIVVLVSVACLIPLAVLLGAFLNGSALGSGAVPLVIGALVYIVVAGIIVAAVCGYMAGLIGSSNSPVSGLAILTVLGASLLLVGVAHPNDPTVSKALIAYALFVTATVINVATISNDNLQDLKTGQLVGATPWRQQVALVVGVVFGAIVIPPILDLLNHAYGFMGSPIHGITAQPLAAPQATLISALANGVIAGQLDWRLIGIGALIGVGVVAIDEAGRAMRTFRFPPLAVALGIYLPMSVTAMVVVGAILGHVYNRRVAKAPNGAVAQRLGVLLASGLIVGESLFGVILSGIIVATSKDAPLALVGDAFQGAATWLGCIAFAVLLAAMYGWIGRTARRIA
ncbi:MAG TPA: oligopeptide transporter, OPT family [Candidatus Baltobacteraceae bacterium]|nr:oligopeptide transporter, OPT family [Candidatus Baltobacteraceae bacterium]